MTSFDSRDTLPRCLLLHLDWFWMGYNEMVTLQQNLQQKRAQCVIRIPLPGGFPRTVPSDPALIRDPKAAGY